MAYTEIPSDAQVVAELEALGGKATAVQLFNALVGRGHPRRDSQLAIQRAAERRRIVVNADLTLSLALEAVAA